MKVKFNVLDRQYRLYKSEYKEAIERVLDSGWYVLGDEVETFEKEFADFTSGKYCVGVNSGLDALTLAFRALGIGRGDEVILPANTHIASSMGITENGASPVPIEPDQYYNIRTDRIERAITAKTKAILVVNLYGQAANILEIKRLAQKYELFLVEDCAHSHGARFQGAMTGTVGHVGCFSFYPTKILGAFGDAGAIVTNDFRLYEKLLMLRNYGFREKHTHEIEGINSR